MSQYRFLRTPSTPYEPQEPEIAIGRQEALECLEWLLTTKPDDGTMNFDLETTGLDWVNPLNLVTNVGLAFVLNGDTRCIGLDVTHLTPLEVQPLFDWLRSQTLGGFNLGFDLCWLKRTWDENNICEPHVDSLQVGCDSLLWFRLLATEGNFMQNHMLVTLQELLGWPPDAQKSWLKDTLDTHNLKKADMYHLSMLYPKEYTRYCALDALGALHGQWFFKSEIKRLGFDGLQGYYDRILKGNILRAIRSTATGIPIDRKLLKKNLAKVNSRLIVLEAKFLQSKDIEPHLAEYIANKVKSLYGLTITQRKEWCKKSDEPWLYPDKYQLQLVGPSKLDKLPAWTRKYGGKFYSSTPCLKATGGTKPWPRLNISSTLDMKWLIYEKILKGTYSIWYRNEDRPEWGGILTIRYNNREYQVNLTNSGSLPTGGDVLKLFGETGKLLNEFKKLGKLKGDFLEKTYTASTNTSRVHPQSKILGTISGRQAGGNE